MRLLIDGNNLLHASDVFPVGKDRSTAAVQQAFLAALIARWTPAERRDAVVVFDGSGGKRNERVDEVGPRVVFPNRQQDADDVLEEWIQSAQQPTKLLVVSSDHRIQRAARQVGADYCDSEIYWQSLNNRKNSPQTSNDAEKPEMPNATDLAVWLDFFGEDRSK